MNSLLSRIRLRWLRWCIDCVRAERRSYEDAGLVGPIYRRNSLSLEIQLMRRARALEQRP